jgi:hypothetical protein
MQVTGWDKAKITIIIIIIIIIIPAACCATFHLNIITELWLLTDREI